MNPADSEVEVMRNLAALLWYKTTAPKNHHAKHHRLGLWSTASAFRPQRRRWSNRLASDRTKRFVPLPRMGLNCARGSPGAAAGVLAQPSSSPPVDHVGPRRWSGADRGRMAAAPNRPDNQSAMSLRATVPPTLPANPAWQRGLAIRATDNLVLSVSI